MKKAHNIWRCSSLIWLFLLCLSMPYESISQNIASITHLEEKDGLANRIIDKIARDSDGYFYLFFDDVIQRYDGKNFANIIISDYFLGKISNIQHVHITPEEKPLIQISNDLSNSFFVSKNQLIPFNQSPNIELITPMSSIFISGNKEQLFTLTEKSQHTYSVTDYYTNEILSSSIQFDTLPDKLFYDKKSQSFIAESTEGIISIYETVDHATKRTRLKHGRIALSKDKIIYTNTEGIYEWTNSSFSPIHLFSPSNHKCLWAKADKKGNILIALHTDVVKIVNLYLLTKEGVVISYNSLLDYVVNIRDVYGEDFKEKMLIGSYNGLYICTFQNKGITNHMWNPSLPTSSFGDVITGVVHDSISQITYLARETDGLYTLANDGKVKKLVLPIDYSNTNSMVYDEKNSKIYSTRYNFNGTGNFNILDIRTKKVESIPLDFSPHAVSLNDDGKVIISGDYKNKNFLRESKNGAILVYDITLQQLTNKEIRGEFLQNSIRICRYFSPYKQYWVGTNDGLYILDENNTILREFSKDAVDQAINIADSHIRMIKSFHGEIYVGTLRDGLYIINPETLEIVDHLKEGNRLTNSSIISAEQDEEGNIWLGSFNGLSVINNVHKTLRKLYIDEGISNPEFNTMASCKNNDGNLFFGSINGVTEVNPSVALVEKERLHLNLESATVFSASGSKVVDINSTSISLTEKVDSIRIAYSVPTYIHQYFHDYESQIFIDQKSNLQVNQSTNSVIFSNLSVGTHHIDFLLKQVSNNTIQDRKSLTLRVKRNYIPWIVSIASILAILGIWYLFTTQKIKSNRLLEEEKTRFNKKLAELELTALRSQMNPHFIFNALGAIQYFINTRDIEKADDYLTKFAKLMRSILESSKSKYIRLQDEIDMLKLYVSLEHIRFEEKFEYQFEVDEQIDILDFTIPSMIIQPVVENAINHGLYHLDSRKGQLSLQFREISEDHIICRIIDNGIGRKAAAEFRKKKSHKSRGMQIVDERIIALKLHEAYFIDIKTTDLSNGTTGTLVEISIERKI